MRFKDRVVIITGGAGKIGKAYAIAFAREGARVSLPDFVTADAVVEEIRRGGGAATSVHCDVTDEASVQAMVEATVKEFGGVDILVNNAAHFMEVKKSPFWEMEVGEFDKAMAVNVRGPWLCAKAAFPYLAKKAGSKIINISSGVALGGNSNYLHYVASKGAIISMTRAMARELGDYNICVNTVAPGLVITEGRQVDPEHAQKRLQERAIKRHETEADIVGTVLFLASADSDFITGQLIVVDGGTHFL
jgi:NAD(P)-dependent dehydrogenase (short-subunit alcohol dehydrogenase family)